MDRESIMAMDPNILLSVINMKLRDTFSSLEGLCEDMDFSEKEICEKLNAIGCTYIREINQFR